MLRADFKHVRNYRFLKKFMALIRFAYDQWEPAEKTYQGQVIQKNFKRFRQDITILAGYYDSTTTVWGATRLEAQSISFARMSAEDFEKLYSAAIDVILKHVLKNFTRSDLDAVVAELMGYC